MTNFLRKREASFEVTRIVDGVVECLFVHGHVGPSPELNKSSRDPKLEFRLII